MQPRLTYGDGDCAFHAAFGTWQRLGTHMIYFANSFAQMRQEFVRFLFFFDSVAQMAEHTTRKYALRSLADFYDMGF